MTFYNCGPDMVFVLIDTEGEVVSPTNNTVKIAADGYYETPKNAKFGVVSLVSDGTAEVNVSRNFK